MAVQKRTTTKTYKIAVIPGDGTGPEVIREGLKVLKAAAHGRFYALGRNWFVGKNPYPEFASFFQIAENRSPSGLNLSGGNPNGAQGF